MSRLSNDILLNVFSLLSCNNKTKMSHICWLWNCLIRTFPLIPDKFRWEKEPDFPTPIKDHACCTVGNSIYVLGGRSYSGYISDQVFALDTTTSLEWIKKTNMLQEKCDFTATVACRQIHQAHTKEPSEHSKLSETKLLSCNIFTIGGWSDFIENRDSIEEYCPTTNMWKRIRGRMKNKRTDHSSCVVNGFIYVFGGCYEKEVDVFDLNTYTWIENHVPNMSHIFPSCLSSVEMNDIIYVIGASSISGWSNTVMEMYDTINKIWKESFVSSVPLPYFGGLVLFNEFVIILGGNMGGTRLDTILIFDINEMEWVSSQVKLNKPLSRFACCIINNYLYIVGGLGYMLNTCSTVWKTEL